MMVVMRLVAKGSIREILSNCKGEKYKHNTG
jgi:hypothetical protein